MTKDDYDLYIAKEDVDKLIDLALSQYKQQLVEEVSLELEHADLADWGKFPDRPRRAYKRAVEKIIFIITKENV